jgi:hypothetical protein
VNPPGHLSHHLIRPELEDGFSDVSGLKTALEALGHPVTILEKVAGGMNGLLVDEDGWLHGAACWRATASPIGISGGQSRAFTESGVPHSRPQRLWSFFAH